jgi:hypothetical protein
MKQKHFELQVRRCLDNQLDQENSNHNQQLHIQDLLDKKGVALSVQSRHDLIHK